MAVCANTECHTAGLPLGRWVQIHEVEMHGGPGERAVQHLFASVACSKRCAVAVLMAELPAEEEQERRVRDLFRGVRPD